MTFKHLRPFICLAILGYCAPSASGAVLYSANFNNASDISGWTVNVAPASTAANQGAITGFDYSAFGIPAAPGNAANDTFGMRLRANVPGGDASPVTTRPTPTPNEPSGLSVSPTGGNFGENFGMTFWAWSNFFGTASAYNAGNNTGGLADNVNSQGGTHNVLFAIGTSGTVPLVAGNPNALATSTMDGIGFATTGDGGIASDYRVFPKSSAAIVSGSVLAAGTAANSNAFYTSLFPSVSAPAIQQTLSTAEFDEGTGFNPMAGLTQAGSFGFAWHKVKIAKYNGIVTWDVNGTRIATYDASPLTLGGNIALGQSDVNNTTARHPSLLFTVFDNLTIYEVPEPASCSLVALGIAAIGLVARRRPAA